MRFLLNKLLKNFRFEPDVALSLVDEDAEEAALSSLRKVLIPTASSLSVERLEIVSLLPFLSSAIDAILPKNREGALAGL